MRAAVVVASILALVPQQASATGAGAWVIGRMFGDHAAKEADKLAKKVAEKPIETVLVVGGALVVAAACLPAGCTIVWAAPVFAP